MEVDGFPISNPAMTLQGTNAFPEDQVIDNSNATVDVLVAGRGVPVGTSVTVTAYSDSEDPQQGSADLQGTQASSMATVQVRIPSGFTRLVASADFTP